MDRINKMFGHDPLTIVEFITAFFLVVGAVYILTPIGLASIPSTIELSAAPEAVRALTSVVGIVVLGLSGLTIGLTHMWAIWRYKYKVRSVMIFSHILLRLYTVLATILAQGFFPLSWLNAVILMCILSVCWLVLRRKIAFVQVVKT